MLIICIEEPLNYIEALTLLGAMELNTAIINHSIVNLNNTRSAEYEGLANCGVYTEHEEDALALATILGSNGKKKYREDWIMHIITFTTKCVIYIYGSGNQDELSNRRNRGWHSF